MKKKEQITDKDFSKMKKVENNRNKYISKGFYMSYSLRISLMIISIIVIGIIAYQCFNVSFSDSYDKKLLYEEKSKLNYKVELTPGNPYDNGELIAKDHYLSDVVSEISTDFNYNIALSEMVDVKYDYEVLAETKIVNKENGNVLSNKTDTLVPKVEKNVHNTSKIDVLQNIGLDYKTYNDNAKQIKDQYAITANGEIVIKMLINMEIKYKDFDAPVTKTQEIKATIPLLEPEVKVTLDNAIDNTDMYKEHSSAELNNKVTLYIGITLLVIDVIFLLLVINFILNTKPKKSKYCILRDGLLKDYDDIIVTSRSIPKFTGNNLIDCYSFSELLDAQKLLKKPIVYCEIVKNQKSLFIIINGDDAYKFTLKEVDIDY